MNTRACEVCEVVESSTGVSESTEAGSYMKQDPSTKKLVDVSEPHD